MLRRLVLGDFISHVRVLDMAFLRAAVRVDLDVLWCASISN